TALWLRATVIFAESLEGDCDPASLVRAYSTTGAMGACNTLTSAVEWDALAISINCFCLSVILMSAGARWNIRLQSSVGSRDASAIGPRVRRRFVVAWTVWSRSGLALMPWRVAALRNGSDCSAGPGHICLLVRART